jgi:hypothetical protein
MTVAALRIERDVVVQETARVARVADDDVHVVTSQGAVRAERARSCLVPPREGDTVLLATSAGGRSWVLAVLASSSAETAVEVGGDLQIRCRRGRLDLGARDGMSLTSAGDLAATAGAIRVRAVDGDVGVSRLTVVARYLASEIDRVKSVAKSFDGYFERLSQRVKSSFRTVEEIDQLSAGQIDYRAGGLASLRSQSTVMTAEELVKIDGGQVHLG